MSKTPNKYWTLCIYLLLALTTLAVFWQLHAFDFVLFDDPEYITENPYIRIGLTRENIIRAFTKDHVGNWHPLTSLSHMLDCQLFGINPGVHHMISLLLHIVNTLLLFAVFKRMTGAIWQSAFVAAVFALHPLHVESVAWISERKDVLSTLFWLLTMAAYLRYVNRPSIARYLLTILAFVMGLMSKQMLVTLPFVLLLLDYWPLGRFQNNKAVSANLRSQGRVLGRLILEKIPFFALSAVLCVVAVLAEQSGGSIKASGLLSLKLRIANTPVAYITYIAKMFWPSRLAVFYPHPVDTLPIWQSVITALLLLAITVLVIRLASKHKYLLTGWFWYLGTLVPVIGLVQIGGQAYADRYTYVPLTGLFIIVAWGFGELLEKSQYRKIVLGALSVTALSALSVCTWTQTGYWRNSITLFTHAINVTENNGMMHNNLGVALQSKGNFDQAIEHYLKALQIKPDSASTHNNLGSALAAQNKLDQAVPHFRYALKFEPDYVQAHNNLAAALATQGQFVQAVEHFRQAVQLRPDWVPPLNNLAMILAAHPDPKLQNPAEALALAQRAAELTNYQNASVLDTLSVAYAASGRFDLAIETAEKALSLTSGPQADYIREQMELYRKSKP